MLEESRHSFSGRWAVYLSGAAVGSPIGARRLKRSHAYLMRKVSLVCFLIDSFGFNLILAEPFHTQKFIAKIKEYICLSMFPHG